MPREDETAALEVHLRAIKSNPEDDAAYFGASIEFAKVGRRIEALDAIEAAIRYNPSVPQYHAHAGHLYVQARRNPQAIAEFLQVIKFEPANVDLHKRLSHLLLTERRPEDALEHFQRVVELEPKNVKSLTELSDVLGNFNRTAEAIVPLRKAMALAPDDAALALRYGRLCVRSGQIREALIAYQRALQAPNPDPEAAYELSVSLVGIGDFEGAAGTIRLALSADPSSFRFQEQAQTVTDILHRRRFALIPATYMAASSEILIESGEITTPKCLVYTNLSELSGNLGDRLLAHLYVRKMRYLSAISLCRLDPATQLFVPNHDEFLPIVANRVVAEQVRPEWNQAQIQEAITACTRHDSIEGPVVLICRYGHRTWGHWLGELMPKIAAVESKRPGHFRYVISDLFIEDIPSRTAVESLRCYGIGPDRIAFVGPGTCYSIPELYVVTSAWFPDWMMHPVAAELMRTMIRLPPQIMRPTEKVALLRRKATTRTIANLDEVERFLTTNGWTIADIEEMDFPSQVSLFRNARCIVAVLGSNLTGLMYAPKHVKVLTLAPAGWADLFFFAMMQERDAVLADIRGTSLADEPQKVASASFRVDVEEIQRGLQALGEDVQMPSLNANAGQPVVISDDEHRRIVVTIEHESANIGDTLTTLPLILQLANESNQHVTVNGQFNEAVKSLVQTLPIAFAMDDPNIPAIHHVINIRASWDYAGPRGLHLAQGHFALANLPAPPLPFLLPLHCEHCALPAGLVISPFSGSEPPDRPEHVKLWPVERWIEVIDWLLANRLTDRAYIVAGSKDDVTPFLRDGVTPVIGYPLSQVLDLMRRAPLCITIDNGISHLAHFGAVERHVLIYPEVNFPTLVTNPRSKQLRGSPKTITVSQVVAACSDIIRRHTPTRRAEDSFRDHSTDTRPSSRRTHSTRRIGPSHCYSWMLSGWLGPVTLGEQGGGTAVTTVVCPDDFVAVRVGFANSTATPWSVTRLIGAASASLNNYYDPVDSQGNRLGNGQWVTFTMAMAGADDPRIVTIADAPTNITVAGNSTEPDSGETTNATWTFTDWVPLSSIGADPATGMRVLMLRALIPGNQTVTFANNTFNGYSRFPGVHRGYDVFVGGIHFDFDLVSDPASTHGRQFTTDLFVGNNLVSGGMMPLVQFITKRRSFVGVNCGDSNAGGTRTTAEIYSYSVQAITAVGRETVGTHPLGLVNIANGGLSSRQIFARMSSLLDATKPAFVVLPGWTANEPPINGGALANASACQVFMARLLDAVDAIRAAGSVPILITPLPHNTAFMTEASRLKYWLELRNDILRLRDDGEIVVDGGGLLGAKDATGTFTGTYRPGMSDDDVHPNDHGHGLIARELSEIIRRIMDL